MRRAKSLRIGVHIANAVVWGPVYRTHLMTAYATANSPAHPTSPLTHGGGPES